MDMDDWGDDWIWIYKKLNKMYNAEIKLKPSSE